jgi:hypothetical protein
MELLEQLLFNNENYSCVDHHDDGDPYDLANPGEGEKSAEKQDERS